MNLGVSHVPREPAETAALSGTAESAGLELFGVADTPLLRGGAFPAIQHALSCTTRIKIGTFVTNPVLRHPAVLAADFAALAELYPNRVVAAIGAGDSAVTSVGLAPASCRHVAEATAAIRRRAGRAVTVLVAASGLRMASRVPPEADGIVLGAGLDPSFMTRMIETAEGSAGHRLARWAFAVGWVRGPDPPGAGALRRILTSVATVGRHGLGSEPAGRGVPNEIAARLKELFESYDVASYGDPNGANTDRLGSRSELADYMLERFSLVGTAELVAGRIALLEDEVGLDGVVLTSNLEDPVDHIERLGREVAPLLAGRTAWRGGDAGTDATRWGPGR